MMNSFRIPIQHFVIISVLVSLVVWPTKTVSSLNLGSVLNPSSILGGGGSSVSSTSQVGRISAGPSLEISRLGCGTWSWGNRLLFDYDTSQDEGIYDAYREIRNAGVTMFDTADSYGTLDLNGRAEILLGQFERQYQQEENNQAVTNNSWWEDFTGTLSSKNVKTSNTQQVATKLAPYPWRITRGQVVNAAKASLQRLQQDKLTIAQLHWSTSKYQPLQERALWEGIADVYDQGLCEAIGVSNYGPRQLRKVANRMQERQVPLAIAQVQYSLMTYQPEVKDLEDICQDVDCRLVSYSPLCLGFLSGKYNTYEQIQNMKFNNPRRQLFLELYPGSRNLLHTLQDVANEYGKTQAQVAINWAMCKGTVPIPGCRTVSQAKENLAATGWSLRSDAVLELDTTALKVTTPMIQNVFQTK